MTGSPRGPGTPDRRTRRTRSALSTHRSGRDGLNTTIGPRGFTHRGGGNWEIAATHFRRRFIVALTKRFDQVVVWREAREGSEKCVIECAGANLDTANDCDCVCLGGNHGSGKVGWMHVGERPLIRPGVVVLTTTIYRGARSSPPRRETAPGSR